MDAPSYRRVAASGDGRGDRDSASVGGVASRRAGVRVHGPDGGPVGRDTVGRVGRDRSDGRSVDGSRDAHEDAARAPGAAIVAGQWRSSRRPGCSEQLARWCSPCGMGGRFSPNGYAGCSGKCQIAAVPHGFRSSFRDWAAEETDHPREVVEAALAHVVGNKVDAAYRRTDLFERRRRLMDDWATYLAGERRDPEATPVR